MQPVAGLIQVTRIARHVEISQDATDAPDVARIQPSGVASLMEPPQSRVFDPHYGHCRVIHILLQSGADRNACSERQPDPVPGADEYLSGFQGALSVSRCASGAFPGGLLSGGAFHPVG